MAAAGPSGVDIFDMFDMWCIRPKRVNGADPVKIWREAEFNCVSFFEIG